MQGYSLMYKESAVNSAVKVFSKYKMYCDEIDKNRKDIKRNKKMLEEKAKALKEALRASPNNKIQHDKIKSEYNNISDNIIAYKKNILRITTHKNKEFDGPEVTPWECLDMSKATFYRMYKLFRKGGKSALIRYGKECEERRGASSSRKNVINNILSQIIALYSHNEDDLQPYKVWKQVNRYCHNFKHDHVSYNLVARLINKTGLKDLDKRILLIDSKKAFEKRLKSPEVGYVLFGDLCDPNKIDDIDNLDPGEIYNQYKHL